MSEVVNNLSSTINHQPEGLHIRVKPLEPMTSGSLDWLESASHQTALEITGDLGHLFLIAR